MNIDEVASRIQVRSGVFAPDWGSKNLAEEGLKYGGRFLDLGTGSGYIAIVQALAGKDVVATDISEKSLECAIENFKQFGVQVEAVPSDWYLGVEGEFGTISYNPPKGSGETELIRRVKNFCQEHVPKRFIQYFSEIYQAMDGKQRVEELESFIDMSRDYVDDRGIVLMNLLPQDAEFLQGHSAADVRELRKNERRTIVGIRYQ